VAFIIWGSVTDERAGRPRDERLWRRAGQGWQLPIQAPAVAALHEPPLSSPPPQEHVPDLLPLLERDVARAAAQDVADRLERMGALASAAEARQVASNG
jgi:hypothetical protein